MPIPLLVQIFLVPLQDDGGFFGFIGGILGLAFGCMSLLFVIAAIAGLWMIFQKAGKPGWAAIIPIYNIWVLLQIVGRPGWWIILYLIPVIGTIVWIVNMWDLARSFDKGIGYTIGLIVLPYIFYIILGFGELNQYYGPAAAK